MGAYLCIASNDVPPAVSKRIILNINCKYDCILFFNYFIILDFLNMILKKQQIRKRVFVGNLVLVLKRIIFCTQVVIFNNITQSNSLHSTTL